MEQQVTETLSLDQIPADAGELIPYLCDHIHKLNDLLSQTQDQLAKSIKETNLISSKTQQDVSHLKNKETKLEENISDHFEKLQTYSSELSSEVESLELQLLSEQRKNEDITQKHILLQEEILRLQALLSEATKQNDDYQEVKQRLTQIESSSAEISKHFQDKTVLNEEHNQELKTKIEQLEKSNQSLSSDLQKANHERDTLLDQLESKKEKDAADYQKEKQHLEEEWEKEKQKMEDTISQYKKREDELLVQLKEVQSHEETQLKMIKKQHFNELAMLKEEQQKKLEESMASSKTELSKLTQDINNKNGEMKKLSVQIKQKDKEIKRLSEDIKRNHELLEAKLREKDAEIKKHSDGMKQKCKENEESKAKLREKDAEIRKLSDDLKQKCKENEESKAKLREKDAEIKKLSDDLKQENNDQLEVRLKEKDVEIENLKEIMKRATESDAKHAKLLQLRLDEALSNNAVLLNERDKWNAEKKLLITQENYSNEAKVETIDKNEEDVKEEEPIPEKDIKHEEEYIPEKDIKHDEEEEIKEKNAASKKSMMRRKFLSVVSYSLILGIVLALTVFFALQEQIPKEYILIPSSVIFVIAIALQIFSRFNSK